MGVRGSFPKIINAQLKLNFDQSFLLSLKEKLYVEERGSLKLEREKFGLEVGPKLSLSYGCITYLFFFFKKKKSKKKLPFISFTQFLENNIHI
jgi:hypothetical protein